MTRNTYLESKPRYEILDGLRGVAALMVVAFHMLESFCLGDPDVQVINHGYLAVDFFFLLSGYVIGYAYDDRWDRMTTWGFFKRRLVRLHPMVIIGMVFGLLLYYTQGNPANPMVNQTPWWAAILITLLGMTLIPIKPLGSWDIRGWGEMHPMDNPAWSLVYEYIANILYALFIRRLPRWALAVCVGLFAVCTLDLTLNINLFGLLQGRDYASNTVIGGWDVYNARDLYIGMTRLMFPFFCGLLLSRFRASIKLKGGFWWCCLMVVVFLAMPLVPGGVKGTPTCLNGWYNAFQILLVFPLIVAIGAGSSAKGRVSGRLCKWLGDISYPLYLIHYPLVHTQMAWLNNNPDASVTQIAFITASLYILAIACAWAVFKLYDEPVRSWLKEHWLKRPSRA